MDIKAKAIYFDSLKTRWRRCLEPREQCGEVPIRSHSIQNSQILNQLCHDGHVIMPRLIHDAGGAPRAEFIRVGRNQASTFAGLCAAHDAELFRPIERDRLDLSNSHHLYLMAYRSVLKETHACCEAACRVQQSYSGRVSAGLSPASIPDPSGLLAVTWISNAYDAYRYKRKYDSVYQHREYDRVVHRCIVLDDSPISIAVSALFSLDDIEWPDDVARVALNVFPHDGRMTVVFSYLSEEERFVDQYLHRLLLASGHYQRYLISKMILQHCENFVISPTYFATMSEDKKQSLIHFFDRTVLENQHEYEDARLYLF